MHVFNCKCGYTTVSYKEDTCCKQCGNKLTLSTLEEVMKPVYELVVDTTFPARVDIKYVEV